MYHSHQQLASIRGWLRAGFLHRLGPQQQRVTINQLLDALEEDYQLRGKDSSQFKAHLKPVRERFGNCRGVEVTAEAVDEFIAERIEDEYSPATVNRSTQLLRQAYKLAIERKRLTSAPMIRHLSESGNARHGFLPIGNFAPSRMVCRST